MEASEPKPIAISVDKPATDQESSTPSPEVKPDESINSSINNDDETVDDASEDDSGARSVSDISEDAASGAGVKRQKIETNDPHENGGERVYLTTIQRREQNRLHARNTRERKKMQLDQSHGKINQLYQERARLCALLAERTGEVVSAFVPSAMPAVDPLSAQQLQEIDDEMKKIEKTQEKYRCNATAEQLWNIRKEKNRIHARKTRLRKKMALDEAEHTVRQLHEENTKLMKKVSRLPGPAPHYPPPELNQYPAKSGMSQAATSTPMMYPYGHGYATSGHIGGQPFSAMPPPQMQQPQMSPMSAPWNNSGMIPPTYFYDYRMGGYMGPPPSAASGMGPEQSNPYDQGTQHSRTGGAMPWGAQFQSHGASFMPPHLYNVNNANGRYPGPN